MAKHRTIKELLDLDIVDVDKMTEKELRKVVGRLRDAGNKKLKRLQKTGLSTPALRQVEKSGGKFSTEGKKLNALRAEYQRIKAFYEAKTSTATGYKKAQAETMRQFKAKGIDVTQEKLDKMYEVYEKIRKDSPKHMRTAQMKYKILSITSVMDDEFDVDEAAIDIYNNLEEIYEEIKRENADFDSISEFFKN